MASGPTSRAGGDLCAVSRLGGDVVTECVPEMPIIPLGRRRFEAYQRLERVVCYCSIAARTGPGEREASLLAVVECV